jgi:hypothetical protein
MPLYEPGWVVVRGPEGLERITEQDFQKMGGQLPDELVKAGYRVETGPNQPQTAPSAPQGNFSIPGVDVPQARHEYPPKGMGDVQKADDYPMEHGSTYDLLNREAGIQNVDQGGRRYPTAPQDNAAELLPAIGGKFAGALGDVIGGGMKAHAMARSGLPGRVAEALTQDVMPQGSKAFGGVGYPAMPSVFDTNMQNLTQELAKKALGPGQAVKDLVPLAKAIGLAKGSEALGLPGWATYHMVSPLRKAVLKGIGSPAQENVLGGMISGLGRPVGAAAGLGPLAGRNPPQNFVADPRLLDQDQGQ